MNRRGFTLMEVLAVVLLLTLAMGATAAGIAASSDATKLRAATAAALDLDRRARLHSRTGARVILAAEPGHIGIRQWATGEQLADVPLPTGIAARLTDPTGEHPLASIVFDCTGATPDYRLVLSLDNQTRSLLIAGLTGWSEDPGESP
jgi:prepilin-type N-terminal cleavage/methylation domain-containing protein